MWADVDAASAFNQDVDRDDTGAIAQAGDVSAAAIQVGDWTQAPGEDTILVSLFAVPCTEAHDFEILHAFDLPAGPYPSVEEMDEAAAAACVPAFKDFVGIAFPKSK